MSYLYGSIRAKAAPQLLMASKCYRQPQSSNMSASTPTLPSMPVPPSLHQTEMQDLDSQYKSSSLPVLPSAVVHPSPSPSPRIKNLKMSSTPSSSPYSARKYQNDSFSPCIAELEKEFEIKNTSQSSVEWREYLANVQSSFRNNCCSERNKRTQHRKFVIFSFFARILDCACVKMADD